MAEVAAKKMTIAEARVEAAGAASHRWMKTTTAKFPAGAGKRAGAATAGTKETITILTIAAAPAAGTMKAIMKATVVALNRATTTKTTIAAAPAGKTMTTTAGARAAVAGSSPWMRTIVVNSPAGALKRAGTPTKTTITASAAAATMTTVTAVTTKKRKTSAEAPVVEAVAGSRPWAVKSSAASQAVAELRAADLHAVAMSVVLRAGPARRPVAAVSQRWTVKSSAASQAEADAQHTAAETRTNGIRAKHAGPAVSADWHPADAADGKRNTVSI